MGSPGADADELLRDLANDLAPDGSEDEETKSQASKPASATPKKAGKKTMGRPSKIQCGKKWCIGCQKAKPIEAFNVKKPVCALPCQRAIDNIKTAYENAGRILWFNAKMKEDAGCGSLADAYVRKCGILKSEIEKF